MTERQLSQRKLAKLVPCHSTHISKIINGVTRPSTAIAERLYVLLDADGTLTALTPPTPRRGSADQGKAAMGTNNHGTDPDSWDDDVKGRAALQLLTTLGVSAGTFDITPLQRLADLALTAVPRDLDDWRLACLDHLHALRTRPAAQARDDLVTDLLALAEQLRTANTGDIVELRRVQAALTMIHAHLSSRLGDNGAAIRWWRTARTAADTTGDLDLQLMIRCEEAKVGLYGQRDLHTVLALLQDADRIAGASPSFWKADLAGTRAKALSLLGRHDQALQALNVNVDYGGPDKPPDILPTLWSAPVRNFREVLAKTAPAPALMPITPST
nr:helix-turn-helix transcriptional regulator [Actinomadura roseirufa]